MKKILCLMLCLLLLVTFAACEDPNEISDLTLQGTESGTATEPTDTQESTPETEDENDGWTNIY